MPIRPPVPPSVPAKFTHRISDASVFSSTCAVLEAVHASPRRLLREERHLRAPADLHCSFLIKRRKRVIGVSTIYSHLCWSDLT